MTADRILRAREADASIHAPDLLNEAETALLRARDGLSDTGHYRSVVDAAALACLRADEARIRAVREKERILRITDRCLRETQALMDEARSLGAERLHGAELGSYSSRHSSLRASLERGTIYEAHDGVLVLKSDLLDFLRRVDDERE